VGELLPARCGQSHLQRGRLLRLRTHRVRAAAQTPARLASTETQILRQRLAVRRPRVVFTGAASDGVTRYRYRGYRIPTPWTPNRQPSPADQRPQHVESPVR
jgi:hypothetical protein